MAEEKIRILFVCLGNICRSPTVEGVFRARAERAGWGALFEVDSAGTAAYHVGEPPDRRSQQHAQARGYNLSALRARQVAPIDFERFDYVLTMDRRNLREMEGIQRFARNPKATLALLLDYHPERQGQEVPDPYYGTDDGFETVLDLAESASDELLKVLLKKQGLFGCGC